MPITNVSSSDINQIAAQVSAGLNAALSNLTYGLQYNVSNAVNGAMNNALFGIQNTISQQNNSLIQSFYSALNTSNAQQANQTNQIIAALNNQQNGLYQALNGINAQIANNIQTNVNNSLASIYNLQTQQSQIINQNLGAQFQASNALINATKTELTHGMNRVVQDALKNTQVVTNAIESSYTKNASLLTSMQTGVETKIQSAYNALDKALNEKTHGLNIAITGVKEQIDKAINQTNTNAIGAFQQALQAINDTQAQTAALIGDEIAEGLLGLGDIPDELYEKFKKLLEDFLNMINDNATDKLNDWSKLLTEYLKDFSKWLTEFTGDTSTDLEKFLTKLSGKNKINNAIGFILFLFMILSSILTILHGFGTPLAQRVTNFANKTVQPNLLPENHILQAFLKNDIGLLEAIAKLNELGYETKDAKQIIANAKNLLNLEDYITLFRRGNLTKDIFLNRIHELGFMGSEVDWIVDLAEFRPPVNDLILMAVREVFTPEIAQKYGLAQDLPEIFINEAKDSGLPQHWAKRYWMAHWQLPSATQGYEMYQRGIISYDELDELLKSLDYMPFWRDKLIQLNYRPYTRVDVRRMYALGILTRSEVKKAYMDIGYNEEKAENLTEFTIKYEQGDGSTVIEGAKNITRSLIEKAYRQGVYNRLQASEELRNLGFDSRDVKLILDLVDLDNSIEYKTDLLKRLKKDTVRTILSGYEKGTYGRENTIRELVEQGYNADDAERIITELDNEREIRKQQYIADAVRDLYVGRTIDESTAASKLLAGGYLLSEANNYVNELKYLREYRTKKPTVQQLQSFLKQEIITQNEFREEIRGLGYDDKYVEWFFRDVYT